MQEREAQPFERFERACEMQDVRAREALGPLPLNICIKGCKNKRAPITDPENISKEPEKPLSDFNSERGKANGPGDSRTGQTTRFGCAIITSNYEDRYGPYLFLRPQKDDCAENIPELGTLQKQQGTATSPLCSSWFRVSSESSSAVTLPLRQRRDNFRLITLVAWRLISVKWKTIFIGYNWLKKNAKLGRRDNLTLTFQMW